MKAVSVVVGNALSKKSDKPLEYFDKPIRITPYTEEEKAEQKKKALQHTIDYLNTLKAPKGKKHE